jgi:hypothetical protein
LNPRTETAMHRLGLEYLRGVEYLGFKRNCVTEEEEWRIVSLEICLFNLHTSISCCWGFGDEIGKQQHGFDEGGSRERKNRN